jgi:hypothetical protein
MEAHVVLADSYVRNSHAGATAFSALPDAPVLPTTDRRSVHRRIRARLAALAHRRPSADRLVTSRPVADCS